jgi:hypothetical protein
MPAEPMLLCKMTVFQMATASVTIVLKHLRLILTIGVLFCLPSDICGGGFTLGFLSLLTSLLGVQFDRP